MIVVSANRAWRGLLSDAGKVYVFKLGATSQWEYLQTLEADDSSDATGVEWDSFGFKIAISGEWIVVGAPNDRERSVVDARAGAAYVFQKTNDGTYTQRAKIMGGQDGEQFGTTAASRRVLRVRAEFASPAQVRSR